MDRAAHLREAGGGSGSRPPQAPGGGGGGAQQHLLPEPAVPEECPAFRNLAQAKYEYPDLYASGAGYRLPTEMQPEELVARANPGWRELYGTQLSLDGLDRELVSAAIGLVLWMAQVPEGQVPNANERDLPWLVRVPLLRVSAAALVTA